MEKVIFTDPATGEQVEFTVEEKTTLNGTDYLLVSEGEDDECNAYIMKQVGSDPETAVFEMVEDDIEFDALARIFEELMDEDTELQY